MAGLAVGSHISGHFIDIDHKTFPHLTDPEGSAHIHAQVEGYSVQDGNECVYIGYASSDGDSYVNAPYAWDYAFSQDRNGPQPWHGGWAQTDLLYYGSSVDFVFAEIPNLPQPPPCPT